ncbi:MAG TPA: type 4a pilus biogenesis protein PilO [Gaiellaceae bacterium]|nr:type 4a pilus biogenesis protein PilO [Gaiellaceae bacterium]
MTAGLKLSLTARTLAAGLAALAVLVGIAGWLVLVGPKRSQASKLEETLQAKQTQVATAERARADAAGPKGAKPKTLAAALPDTLAMPEVVDQLNALARRSGVTLDTVTPAAAVAGAGYDAVPINVVVDGHYFAVEQFLHLVRTQVRLDKERLHAAGRLFDVQSVSLQQTEPAPMVTATLSLRAFYFTGAPAAAPAATTTTQTGTTASEG